MKLSELFEKQNDTDAKYDVTKHQMKDNGEYGLATVIHSGLSKAEADAKKSELFSKLGKEGYLVRVVPHGKAVTEKK